MQDESYFTALQAASHLLHVLDGNRATARPERLAHATFTILDAIRLAEERQAAGNPPAACPHCLEAWREMDGLLLAARRALAEGGGRRALGAIE